MRPDLVIAAIACALLAALAGAQTMRLSSVRVELAQEKKDRSDERAQAEKDARMASEAYRREEQRWREATQKGIDDAQARIAAAEAGRAAAATAGERLRRALAAERAARSGAAACEATPAEGGPPPASPADLHADVQRRLDEAADGIAGFADRLSIALGACEAIADSTEGAAP